MQVCNLLLIWLPPLQCRGVPAGTHSSCTLPERQRGAKTQTQHSSSCHAHYDTNKHKGIIGDYRSDHGTHWQLITTHPEHMARWFGAHLLAHNPRAVLQCQGNLAAQPLPRQANTRGRVSCCAGCWLDATAANAAAGSKNSGWSQLYGQCSIRSTSSGHQTSPKHTHTYTCDSRYSTKHFSRVPAAGCCWGSGMHKALR